MSDLIRHSGRLEPAEEREFLPFVRELAAVSAAVINGLHLQGTPVETKADASPVTLADRRAEALMRLLIGRRYPEHGVLGEEGGDERPQARYRWVLDPVDGTQSFVANGFGFGTLIALPRDGRPILGAISHPPSGRLLLGLGGDRTLLGERPVRVRACRRVEDATLLATGHWELCARPDGAAFEALARRARLYRGWGDCIGYFQLATGGADLVFDAALQPWDIAALVPVVEGAGGRLSGLDGGPPMAARDLLASGSPALHAEVLRELARARAAHGGALAGGPGGATPS